MLAKYHLLLQQESTRLASSSEEVMLARYWDSEERQALAKEKEEIQNGQVLELPALPSEWASKYEEIYSSKPPDGVEAVPLKVEEEEEVKPDVNSDEIKQETEMSNDEFKPETEVREDSKPEMPIFSLKRPLEQMGDGEMVIKEEDLEEQVGHFSLCVSLSLTYLLRFLSYFLHSFNLFPPPPYCLYLISFLCFFLHLFVCFSYLYLPLFFLPLSLSPFCFSISHCLPP